MFLNSYVTHVYGKANEAKWQQAGNRTEGKQELFCTNLATFLLSLELFQSQKKLKKKTSPSVLL